MMSRLLGQKPYKVKNAEMSQAKLSQRHQEHQKYITHSMLISIYPEQEKDCVLRALIKRGINYLDLYGMKMADMAYLAYRCLFLITKDH